MGFAQAHTAINEKWLLADFPGLFDICNAEALANSLDLPVTKLSKVYPEENFWIIIKRISFIFL